MRDKNNRWKPEPKYQALFLLIASSGLRFGEALILRRIDIDIKKRMLLPKSHDTDTTKRAWVTFYNRETAKYLTWIHQLRPTDRVFPSADSIYRAFATTQYLSNIYITPQILREWFYEEMGTLSVPDRYIDAFCGRVPKSVLSRRYTDYSPKKLKSIYERANLLVLS